MIVAPRLWYWTYVPVSNYVGADVAQPGSLMLTRPSEHT